MSAEGAALSFDERLKIEHACTRLSIDYSHFADARQMDAWAELFAEDAELVVMGAVQRGRAAIRNSVGDGTAETASFHSNSNIRIDVVSATEARGEICATVFVVPVKDGKAQTRDLAPTIIGKYLDTYRKTPGGWRFGRREFVATMTRMTD
ncbi:MAG: nuclear transport factor 2 family protein [Alphaproteobacteria bacterium]|nr:nuclear transport factor 2 family protein [Alphaproteobacteria bacterium]